MTVSNFISYENYKDTSIIWLEKSPAHWEIKRLKDIGKSIIGLTYSPDEMVDNADEGILVLRSSNIQNGALDLSSTVYVKKTISTKLALKKGDILICSRNGSRALIGKNICIDERVAGQTFGAFMTVYRSKYFTFLSKFFNSKIFESQSGLFMSSTVNQLTQNTLNNFLILLPPLEEQQAIADYLDTKTAQIDRKIELLKQKAEKYADLKQSLINETVTRGLDKTVPMKDSEVKWIGQIPAHWEVKRIKDLFVQSKNKVGSKSNLFKVLSLTQNGVIERDIENGKGKFPATFDGYQIVVPDSLLLCLFDMDVTPRIIGYVDQIGLATSAYTSIVGSKYIFSKYYYYYFLNQDRNKSLLANGKGLRSTITFDNFGLLRIPFPPLEEQKAIAEYLEVKTVQIEKIIETIDLEVEKLTELRKTLINDVVTGKIKVHQT